MRCGYLRCGGVVLGPARAAGAWLRGVDYSVTEAPFETVKPLNRRHYSCLEEHWRKLQAPPQCVAAFLFKGLKCTTVCVRPQVHKRLSTGQLFIPVLGGVIWKPVPTMNQYWVCRLAQSTPIHKRASDQ
jgi:hypothetical protein